MFPYFYIFGKMIPMYGLCITVGIAVAALIMVKLCKSRGRLWEDATIIGTSAVAIGFVGAKILYLFVTYTPAEFWALIVSGEFMTVMNGGFVFYGGLIAGVIGALVGTKIAKTKLGVYEPILVPLVPIAHAFGRIGCFMAGCCYGRVTDASHGLVYTWPLSDAPVNVPLVPVQLYEAAFCLVLGIVLLCMFRRKLDKFLLPTYLAAYAIERFVIEYWRYDEIRGIFGGLSTSQWISIGMLVAAFILVVVRLPKKKED